MSFADIAARDPRFTLDRYFDGILRRHPKIKTSEIVAALADKDIVALRGPDDRLWIVSTKDESRNQIELPKAGKIAAAGISQDGDNIVVFLEHTETDGLTGKRHLAYLAKVNASGVPITLDVASDFRCRRVSSQPRFRTLDGSIVAVDADRTGICVWNATTGKLIDRLERLVKTPSQKLGISPSGHWVINFDENTPTMLWSTNRQLKTDQAHAAETLFEPVPYCKLELDSEPCPTLPAAGVKIRDQKIEYGDGQAEPTWQLFANDLLAPPSMSPSGKYAVVTSVQPSSDDGIPGPKIRMLGLMQFEKRNVLCQQPIPESELRRLSGIFVFDTGPSVFLQKAINDEPVLAHLDCREGFSPKELSWRFRHGRNGDTGIMSVIRDARISRDGRSLLTLANDRTWRLWDITLGLELIRSRTTDSAGHFGAAPNGPMHIVLLENSSDNPALESMALPPDVAQLAKQIRQAN